MSFTDMRKIRKNFFREEIKSSIKYIISEILINAYISLKFRGEMWAGE